MRSIKLQNRPGTGTYIKGQERIEQILVAAQSILIDKGYSGLSMRKIAAAVGITIGNLHYYYPSKKDLLADLLDHVIEGYMLGFDNARAEAGSSALDQFVAIITFIVDDLTTHETTNFFPELWAMANHDEQAAERMHELYRKARLDINDLIAQINPTLSHQQREEVGLFISASLEGLTPFVGNGKPWNANVANIKRIAIKSFVDLVTDIRDDDVAPPNNELAAACD